MNPVQTPAAKMAESLYGAPEPSEPSEVVSEPSTDEQKDNTPEAAEKPETVEKTEPEGERGEEEIVADSESDDDLEDSSEDAEGAAFEEVDDDDQYMQTVEELAEHLETEPGFIEHLKVKQKINGEMVDVTIADALATHRKVRAADQVLEEAKTKRSQMLSEVDTEKKKIGENLAIVNDLVAAYEAEFSKISSGVDMEKLRQDDPQEWTARKQEMRDMQERMAKLKENARQTYNKMITEANEAERKRAMERLPQEQEILLERVPEWTDETKASKERADVLKYLQEQGFTESEVSVAGLSGKATALAVKAMRYDRLKGRRSAMRKKVARIPKVVKPGTRSADSKPEQQPEDRASLLYGS